MYEKIICRVLQNEPCLRIQQLHSQGTLCILCNPKVNDRVHNNPPFTPVLSNVNQGHAMPSHHISLWPILIVSHLHLGLPNGSFFQVESHVTVDTSNCSNPNTSSVFSLVSVPKPNPHYPNHERDCLFGRHLWIWKGVKGNSHGPFQCWLPVLTLRQWGTTQKALNLKCWGYIWRSDWLSPEC
jgi:hypothetical protein